MILYWNFMANLKASKNDANYYWGFDYHTPFYVIMSSSPLTEKSTGMPWSLICKTIKSRYHHIFPHIHNELYGCGYFFCFGCPQNHLVSWTLPSRFRETYLCGLRLWLCTLNAMNLFLNILIEIFRCQILKYLTPVFQCSKKAS